MEGILPETTRHRTAPHGCKKLCLVLKKKRCDLLLCSPFVFHRKTAIQGSQIAEPPGGSLVGYMQSLPSTDGSCPFAICLGSHLSSSTPAMGIKQPSHDPFPLTLTTSAMYTMPLSLTCSLARSLVETDRRRVLSIVDRCQLYRTEVQDNFCLPLSCVRRRS